MYFFDEPRVTLSGFVTALAKSLLEADTYLVVNFKTAIARGLPPAWPGHFALIGDIDIREEMGESIVTLLDVHSRL